MDAHDLRECNHSVLVGLVARLYGITMQRIVKHAVIFWLFACSLGAAANNCRSVAKVCVDATPTKQVSGYPVTLEQVGGCWEYKETYECISPESVDYCAAIAATPGCNMVGSTCSQTAFNGECNILTHTYRCGEIVSGGAEVIRLDDSYSIVYDEVDTTPCASHSSNSSCKLASKQCIEGPGTRNINGLDVYKECWQWQEDYSCVVSDPKDFCAPLKSVGCVEQAAVCTNTAFTGACIERKFDYVCGEKLDPPPTNVILLDTTYTINDKQNVAQCESIETSPNCTVASQTCTKGPETRVVDNQSVYRDCWEWEKNYVCTTTTPVTNCGELSSNALCTKTASECLETGQNGACALWEHEYKCADAPPKIVTETDCGSQVFCMGGECFDTGYSPDQDFKLAVVMKEAMRQAGSYSIFEGEANYCEDKLWGAAKCCKSKGGGEAGKNSNVVGKMGLAGAMYAGERVIEIGSSYMYDALFQYSASATYSFLGNSAATAVEQGLFQASMPSATLSMYGVSWSTSGALAGQGLMGANVAINNQAIGGGYFYFNPYVMVGAVVMQVIMNYMECEEEEQKLSMKRGQDLCYRVGSWCSRKILGSCEKRKQSWCCFPSVLGRVVNEQGRQQIGKGWGPRKSPDCSGFTEEELQKLRFDEMDLSEFIAVIAPNVKGGDLAQQRLEDRMIREPKSYYESVKPGQ